MLTPMILALALAADPQPKAGEHPIATEVRAALADPAKPFTMVVRLKLKDGSGPQFEAAFAKVAKESRKEKGNRAYDLARSAKDKNEYLVYERWDTFAALEAHLKSPHFLEAAAATPAMLDGKPEIKVFLPAGE